jgi:1,4-alpha-glucan branching enzyme
MASPFALVLHTHLPMVVNHGRWPHGSDWLCEATFECYLPLLETAHRLVADGISPKWTINLSPVLTEQLASPEFQKELSFYHDNARRACAESREHFTREGQKEIVRLTHFWEEFFERMWEMHRRIGGDIPGTFADLQRAGHVEIITCAATHGYLPLLARDESIHLQLRTAVETHRRHFGRAPRGIWLPECAYRPRYEWTPPTGRDSGRERRMRPGIEEMLAVHGLEYFVADSHLVAAGQPMFLYRDYIPLKEGHWGEPVAATPSAEARSPYAPYRVASRGGTGQAVAFFRDPRSTVQVWSREHGYPGEFAYLEFHKKHFPGGLRFWRITDNQGDLGTKAVYDPDVAAQKAGRQASHFVELVADTLARASGDGPALVCSPYDSELFGHWWFEGPRWLEHVARGMARAGLPCMTLGEALEAVPPRATLGLPEGSWGEGGDHRVWLNRDTEWTWDRVYSAEAEWVDHLAGLAGRSTPELRRVLTQAARELLLLQSSDWQFLITTGTASDYAERRVAEHYADFKRLCEMARALEAGDPLSSDAAESLRRIERDDFCFPDLDPAWSLGAPAPQ